MKSKVFWNSIEEENILLFQTDSFVLKGFKIDEYMDFSFIGGSMGSVVGEKIFRGIDYANQYNLPLFIITSSGGARMQEGVYSLMQLAKTSGLCAYRPCGLACVCH